MNLEKLLESAQKPEIYTKGTAVMWTDEYISTQLLETHLNQDTDLASRKEVTIAATINWIVSKVPGDRLNILDLGCGPGLYAEKFAALGHQVTGIDFSANSIRYAKASARRQKMPIAYLQKDYLTLEEENKYDLILMIFTDFGVLSPDDRSTLLKRIFRALKPGGKFIFDVLNENFDVNESGSRTWEVSPKGFWRNRPYLALTETFYYAAHKVILNQHIVIEETGKTEVYRFWSHTFSHAELDKILAAHQFGPTEYHEDLLPGCVLHRGEDVTFCITTR